MTEVLPRPVGRSSAWGIAPSTNWSKSRRCHRIGGWPVRREKFSENDVRFELIPATCQSLFGNFAPIVSRQEIACRIGSRLAPIGALPGGNRALPRLLAAAFPNFRPAPNVALPSPNWETPSYFAT